MRFKYTSNQINDDLKLLDEASHSLPILFLEFFLVSIFISGLFISKFQNTFSTIPLFTCIYLSLIVLHQLIYLVFRTK